MAAFAAEKAGVRRVGENGPMSLSALRQTGNLTPGIDGLATLTIIVERTDRPHEGWPRLKTSGNRLVQAGIGIRPVEPDQEFVQKVQDLLIKYGDAMEEAEMLPP